MDNIEWYNREYVDNSALNCEILKNYVLSPSNEDIKSLASDVKGEKLYLGDFHTSHYGNFLIDNLNRLWYVVKCGYEGDYIYTSRNLDIVKNPLYMQILSYFGIDSSNLTRITKPTRFQKLIVPEKSFVHGDYFSSEYITIYDLIRSKIRINDNLRFEKVYLTRTHLKRRKEIGERVFEKFFEMNGFQVIAPEEMSFVDQISVVCQCKVLASLEGTLAHNIIFANGTGVKRQIILKKQSEIIPRQFMLNQACGVPAEYLNVYQEPFKGFPISHDRGPFLLVWNDEIRKFAITEGMKISFRVGRLWKIKCFVVYSGKCLIYWLKHNFKKRLFDEKTCVI